MNIEIPYEPRAYQLDIHKNLKRWSVLVCHRRFGKTVLTINQLIASALRSNKENPRYAYIAPLYKQAKTIAWDMLKLYTNMIPGVKYNESELRCDFPNGARITLYGADNPDALRGVYLDGVVLDEYAQMNPKMWSEVLRPALSDRKGYAIWIGTPAGHNSFYDLYVHAKENDDWFAAMYKASETKIIDEDELKDAARTMSPDEYNQEYECSFEASIKGAYYADQIKDARTQGRISKVPYDPHLEVHTAWDLGIGDSTCILFYQMYGKEIRIIDAEEHHGEPISFYYQLLQDKPYKYGQHYLPHDAQARELGSGKTIEEQLRQLGMVPRILQRQNVMDGIQATRQLFPRLWIQDTLTDFTEAITQYRKEFDEKKNTFKDKPLHDWSSHYADSLRYLSMAIPKDVHRKERKRTQSTGWRASTGL